MVEGSQQLGLKQIITRQDDQTREMNDLEYKFATSQQRWQIELAKNEQQINSKKFDHDDMKQMKIMRGMLDPDDEDNKIMRDSVILHLQESLVNPNIMPDDICNILQNDLFEKQKLRESTNAKIVKQNLRFTCKHIDILQDQF